MAALGFFLFNEHWSFMILFSRKTYYFISLEIMQFEMLLLIKTYFECKLSVWASKNWICNSREIFSISVLSWKYCHLNLLKCLNSEVKNKNPTLNCISIIAYRGSSVSEVKKLILAIDLELHFCTVNTSLKFF